MDMRIPFLLKSALLALFLIAGCAAPPLNGARVVLDATPPEGPVAPATEVQFEPDSLLSSDNSVTAENCKEDGAAAASAPSAQDFSAPDVNQDEEQEQNAEESVLDEALGLIDEARENWAIGEQDKAIDALDQAYAVLLRVPADADPKVQQQKEDIRLIISRRITEIYASRVRKTNGKHAEIPLTVNEHVEREIRLFQTLERNFFLESYKRSGRYRERFVKAFREAGLPEDLSWLPLIESGFKARALSRARALGLWQFIPSTGYKYGLKRNDWIDERLDPEKSTTAAIAYLRELHEIFGDWATVLAAYNCGEGNVLRVIRGQKVNYLDNFWDLYERLPRETARYYPRFLATLAIIKDPAKYGFTLETKETPVPFDVVRVERPLHLRQIADRVGVSDDVLADLNPELRHQSTPDGAYDLRVPVGTRDAVLACLDSLPRWSPPRPAYVVHRVRKGETLSTIALRYRTSIQRIMDANNLRNGRLLRVGQKLKIPQRGSS
jgi:membrane-bound lytic murein transglycosylase D